MKPTTATLLTVALSGLGACATDPSHPLTAQQDEWMSLIQSVGIGESKGLPPNSTDASIVDMRRTVERQLEEIGEAEKLDKWEPGWRDRLNYKVVRGHSHTEGKPFDFFGVLLPYGKTYVGYGYCFDPASGRLSLEPIYMTSVTGVISLE